MSTVASSSPSSFALQSQIALRRGAFGLAMDLDVAPGETVALIGPNGAGKSTALRCLAGLAAIDHGTISLHGRVLDDPQRNVFVAPTERRVGMVFQNYALFAHLSALDNVAFGLRANGIAKRDAHRRAHEWLERVDLAEHARAHPGELSGGQQQRVALARALIVEPAMLLLDEPLAALDASTRGDVRRMLRTQLDTYTGPCVVVTHDPVDAQTLASRAVVLEDGMVTQTGAFGDITARPRSRYAADLAGTNLVIGQLRYGVLTVASGATVAVADADTSGSACAVIAPRTIALFANAPDGSPRNSWPLRIVDIDDYGERVRVRLDGALALTAEITPRAYQAMALTPGQTVWATVKASEVTTQAL